MQITITLTPERYDALTKTAELNLPDGTPEEYLQGVIDSACDSYAQTPMSRWLSKCTKSALRRRRPKPSSSPRGWLPLRRQSERADA